VQVNLVVDCFVNRFQTAVRRLSKPDETRILLAVSGGPDSLALMLLAHAAMPDRIVAATVDHELRPEAADEAAYVAALCADRAIPHRVLSPEQAITGNVQSSARIARYALLERAADDAGCSVIATAHHADDQLETLLMRLARGSGIDGMSGVRPRNGRIIRPLLQFSKSELEEICRAAAIEPIRDPSNDNSEFDRVAVRQWLSNTPHPLSPVRANRTAAALHDSSVALQWMVDLFAVTRIFEIDHQIQCDANGLPHELQRRLVLTSIARLDPDIVLRGATLERLIDDLTAGRTSTVGDVLCKGGELWYFSPAPPRRSV
jgi:tRNA(Ile)-lysidine synthase